MHKMSADGIEPHEGDQGFVDSDGEFQNRQAALLIAIKADQIIMGPSAPKHGLFSEDVW